MLDYQYRSLQKGEIRLLRLDATNASGQFLSGSIVHHRLVNPTYRQSKDAGSAYLEYSLPYEALSYHWGSNDRAGCKVLIHDDDGNYFVIRITKTLHSILRRLALPDKHRVIWADAICINQINSSTNSEKGEQIQLMPDIYRTAACVQVYLGDKSADVPAALELLSSLADYSEHLDDLLHAEGEIGLDLALRNGFVMPSLDDKKWQALRAFFCRPWFRRVWVIQEFVYATDVRVLCGDLEIDWHRLWLASKAYVSNRNLMHQGFGKESFLSFFFLRKNRHKEALEGALALHRITDLRLRAMGYMSGPYIVYNLGQDEPANVTGLSIRRNLEAIKGFEKFARDSFLLDRSAGKAFPYGRSTLLELLHDTSNFQATKPIDRLYALLGLADDADGYQPIYSADETAAVVSTRFAATFINNGHLQRVLASAGIRSHTFSSRQAPSWVPDWTRVRYAQHKLIGFTLVSMAGDKSEQPRQQRKIQRQEQRYATENKEASVHSTPPLFTGFPGIESIVDSNHDPLAKQKGDSAAKEAQADDASKETADAPAKLYNAAAGTEPSYSGDAFWGKLVVRGSTLGRIVLVLPGKLMLPCQLYENMILNMGTQYPTGEPAVEAVWRTLIGNRTMHGDPAPPEFAAQYELIKKYDNMIIFKACLILVTALLVASPIFVLAIRFLPIVVHVGIVAGLNRAQYVRLRPAMSFLVLLPIFRWLYIWVLIPVLLALAWHLMARLYPSETLDMVAQMGCTTAVSTSTLPADCAPYASSMSMTANRHVLCVMQQRLIGLMPVLTREGDMVVIFHGCDVPYVIRPAQEEQGCYRLVGEAYVHGVMNGEAMQNGGDDCVDVTLI
ncbi:hypothetical protein E4U42_007406 [Claviceps africana]|uniref:Heterokaryon incompatibility domain-containing protein n=1 Tax=Claviceps africana TaxID=83212 RepID=A0A8K0J1R8_9HYPO|nr:hypothetical protein E4U42_007406 [Claviceps africana]